MKTFRFAVTGKNVSKSDSPAIHSFIAESAGRQIIYDKLSIPEESFGEFTKKLFKEYDGFNVTIPFKLEIIPYLKELKGDAQIFGAVNTVKSAQREGYNTDGEGFALMLKNASVEINKKRVLLLGAGGAGRSAAKKLKDGGAAVDIYDRDIKKAEGVAEEFGVNAVSAVCATPYDIIINATGIGMHKTEGLSPVDKEVIALCDTAVDLIYVPEKSAFLQIAENLGKKTLNGKAMLFYQAYYAQCIFFGDEPDEEKAKSLFEIYSKN